MASPGQAANTLLSLAQEEEAARTRRDEAKRPRIGWRLVRARGIDARRLRTHTHSTQAWGRRLYPPWRYEITDPAGHVKKAGQADSLADATRVAETLSGSRVTEAFDGGRDQGPTPT